MGKDYISDLPNILRGVGDATPYNQTERTSKFVGDGVLDVPNTRAKGNDIMFKDINALTLGDNTNSNDTYDNHGTNNGIIGHAHAPVTIILGRERNLSEQETALIDIFNRLDAAKQAKLLVLADELGKE